MSVNEMKDHVKSEVQKSNQLKNAVELIKGCGPLTESEVVKGRSKGISTNAAKSDLQRAYKRRQLSRVITVENNRPVWLYFTPEQETSLNEIKRVVWVPLNELEEYKTTIIREAFNKNKRKWVTLNMVAKRTGFPPGEIERETYYVARALGIDIISTQQALEHFKDMTLGLRCFTDVPLIVSSDFPFPRLDFLEHALQHVVTGFHELCDKENFMEVVSHLVRSPFDFEKLDSICEDCGVPEDNDKKKAKELFESYHKH